MAPGEAGISLQAVNLVPLVFDDDLVLITAHFADHGISQRYFRLHVTPSCKGLKSIALNTFPMDDGHLRVTATLHYDQLRDPVQFSDLKRLTYRIDPSATPGVLRIEPDGQIRRVRSGYAAIIATYCGVTGGVSVKVNLPMPSQSAPTPHP
jgi:L-fucose mutarotase/ribose pyranase (RbsD/FucU family)